MNWKEQIDMATYEDREAFIPYRRRDLIELCIRDGRLPREEIPKFREFCTILTAHYHFKFHQILETLKENYAPFNPDAETQFIGDLTPDDRRQMGDRLTATFGELLEAANYFVLSKKALNKALEEQSLIDLHTNVDFDEFANIICYCRGEKSHVITVKKWGFKNEEVAIKIFERVVLLLRFKGERYFQKKGEAIEDLEFKPGKAYIYFYKNVPKNDLDLLFPNVKTYMTWKDRLMLIVPAIGAAVAVVLRVLPQALLIFGVILFFVGDVPGLEDMKANERQVQDIMPVLVAFLSILIALGGFGFKQYSSYKSKKIQFQKHVTETLFFKNLANNSSVFHAVTDLAEEEECKEIILVYYHLLTSPTPLTPEQLDDRIEKWMEETFGTKIDFDINGPLKNLADIRGKIVRNGEDENKIKAVPLLRYRDDGSCQVLSLEDAKTAIDYLWDRIYN